MAGTKLYNGFHYKTDKLSIGQQICSSKGAWTTNKHTTIRVCNIQKLLVNQVGSDSYANLFSDLGPHCFVNQYNCPTYAPPGYAPPGYAPPGYAAGYAAQGYSPAVYPPPAYTLPYAPSRPSYNTTAPQIPMTYRPAPNNAINQEYTFTMETGKEYSAKPSPSIAMTNVATSPLKAESSDRRKLLRKHPNSGHVAHNLKPKTEKSTHYSGTFNMAHIKRERQIMHLPFDKVTDLFLSTPYFMGELGTHGQEVHMAAILCAHVDAADRRWPNPRYVGKYINKLLLCVIHTFAGEKIYDIDPEFAVHHPKFHKRRVALWRERLYCMGRHGCSANPLAPNQKHRKCAVEIICTIWADAPDQMEIKFDGEHGPQHKPPAATEVLERKLTYDLDEWIKEQLKISPNSTPTELHIAISTTLKNRFAKSGVVS
jgi:hypothetical protein